MTSRILMNLDDMNFDDMRVKTIVDHRKMIPD